MTNTLSLYPIRRLGKATPDQKAVLCFEGTIGREHMEKVGANAYIPEPADRDVLLKVVGELARKKEAT